MRVTAIAVIFATLLLGACLGSGDDTPASEYPPELPLDPEFTACTDVALCDVVQLGCCDDCNGGLAVSVHIEKAAEVIERFSERCGEQTSCTLRGCAPPRSACNQGVCQIVRDPL